ncbi:uncharacterized protein DNG_05227 [Cephalotrichum gorgonifer]|uniref:Uncharacterized protein n=1 Tax=Cephalotrichum gorgonifer TaxID=2041049 RepID=A0AAE8MZB6_9PEZI|nr:uncharacterized protein DNG_05227 [Cephalotrichum gorgonifer]
MQGADPVPPPAPTPFF